VRVRKATKVIEPMLKRYRVRDYNFRLVLLLLTVTIIGILAIGSADQSFQKKQILGLLMGFFLMVVISLFDYSFFLNLHWFIYAANLVLLLLVRFMGHKVSGATRWLVIFGIQFQPSELAKILLILFYAQYIMKHKEHFNTWKNLLSMIALLVPPAALIYLQPDLKSTIIIGVVFIVIMYMGGLSYKIIGAVLLVVVPLSVILLMLVIQPDQKIIEPYQQDRILAWLNPSEYKDSEGYQQENSITAIGSGQLHGKGLNNNEIASVKNGNFILEPQNDFIFAIIGEELGFIGGSVVIILLYLIAFECALIAKQSKDLGGVIICSGMAAIIAFQSFVNISVATGIFPNTGVPLPFVSSGLTSLVSLYIGMGFVLNVNLQRIKKYS